MQAHPHALSHDFKAEKCGLKVLIVLQEPRAPQRASLRIKGLASDGTSVHEELRNGQIIVKGGVASKGQYQPIEEEPKRQLPTGTLQTGLTLVLGTFIDALWNSIAAPLHIRDVEAILN